jgi:hypothetical protein
MHKALFWLVYDFVEKFVLAWLENEGKLKPSEPEPKPVPEPEPGAETPDDPVDPDPKSDDQVPGNPTTSTKSQKLYIPRVNRQDWIDKINNAYSVWRGEREYGALLEDTVVWDDHKWPYSRANIVQFMRSAQESNAKAQRLIYRINKEIHRNWPDRCQVRKSVANDMVEEMKLHTARYTAVSSFFPQVNGCDTMACKMKKGVYPSS